MELLIILVAQATILTYMIIKHIGRGGK